MPHMHMSRFEQEHMLVHHLSRGRRVRAALRDTWVLIREFRTALIAFLVVWFCGALSFNLLWNITYPDQRISFLEAFYDVLTMVFFQPSLEFPDRVYLDMYFFIMPLLGVSVLGLGMADFASLLFNRNLRHSKWEEAVVSTFNDHVIVCGLGHVGLRVVKELILLGEEVVVIEADKESPRFSQIEKYDVPIIIGDGRIAENLLKAGLDSASAFIIATNDDLMNLQIASRIRELNQDIRLVMRMWDEQFARSIADRFNINAVYSASNLAAPAFAGAAAGAEILHTFRVEGSTLVMGRVEVQVGGPLDQAQVMTLETRYDMSVVLLHSSTGIDVSPEPEYVLQPGDVIAVVGHLPNLKQLTGRWKNAGRG